VIFHSYVSLPDGMTKKHQVDIAIGHQDPKWSWSCSSPFQTPQLSKRLTINIGLYRSYTPIIPI
jgi:hypothetical protein